MILVDISIVMHRCYHAMDHLQTSKGVPTGMEYGTLRLLRTLKKRLEVPESQKIVLCFDAPRPQKKKVSSLYKANREPKPESFYLRMNALSQALCNIYCWCKEPGYEADELLFSISDLACNEINYIYTNDSDLLQAVSKTTVMIKSHESKLFWWDEISVRNKYKVRPHQFALLKSLMGDKTDNLPKLKGFSAVFLAELVREVWLEKDPDKPLASLFEIMNERDQSFSKRQQKSWKEFFSKQLLENYRLIKLKRIHHVINEPIGGSIQSYLDILEIKTIKDVETETEF